MLVVVDGLLVVFVFEGKIALRGVCVPTGGVRVKAKRGMMVMKMKMTMSGQSKGDEFA